MKKFLFAICLIASLSNAGFAQSKVRMGFLAGVNYADYSAISGINVSPKIAFLAGINTEIKLNNKLFLTADLHFERKRAESGVWGYDLISGRDLYTIVQNDYIVLPVNLKYEFKKYDAFYLTVGLYSAYLVNSYYYDTYEGDFSNRFQKMDFGLCFGIGKTFNITPSSRINIELRESAGLANIDSQGYFGEGNITTNTLSLVCGYSFDLK